MSEMSMRFNFDDFDRQIAEALDEHYVKDLELLEQSNQWAEKLKWQEPEDPDYDPAA